MKKPVILALITLAFVACGDGGEQKAQLRIQAAEQALTQGDYNEAKLQIDSIKILYPKAFEARRLGIKLIQRIELKEQEKSLVYLDSMLQTKQKEFEAKKGHFVLEKDAEYQKIGNYFYPSQTVEKNMHRTFLRAQVNELGMFSLTSIYCGGGGLHHSAIKVSVKDGSFAQTPPSKDRYESADLGERTEKCDYQLSKDGGVTGFIYLNKDQNIKLEYIGSRRYVSAIGATDRKAIAEVFGFSQIISSIEQIKKEITEANLKIRFIHKKMGGE